MYRPSGDHQAPTPRPDRTATGSEHRTHRTREPHVAVANERERGAVRRQRDGSRERPDGAEVRAVAIADQERAVVGRDEDHTFVPRPDGRTGHGALDRTRPAAR